MKSLLIVAAITVFFVIVTIFTIFVSASEETFPISQAIHHISEQFMARSLEIDDTLHGKIILRQEFIFDEKNFRNKMIADGQLVGGYMQQITRCDTTPQPPGLPPNTRKGYFLQIAGFSFNRSGCENETIEEEWAPGSGFWSFPANASFLGKQEIPKTHDKREAYAWKYWMQHEKYLFFADIRKEWKNGKSVEVVIPLWEGKVTIAVPTHHLYHFEYSAFVAGAPPLDKFKPNIPPNVTCSRQQQQNQEISSQQKSNNKLLKHRRHFFQNL